MPWTKSWEKLLPPLSQEGFWQGFSVPGIGAVRERLDSRPGEGAKRERRRSRGGPAAKRGATVTISSPASTLREDRQKFYYSFEVRRRLQRAGFKGLQFGKVLYPWYEETATKPSPVSPKCGTGSFEERFRTQNRVCDPTIDQASRSQRFVPPPLTCLTTQAPFFVAAPHEFLFR